MVALSATLRSFVGRCSAVLLTVITAEVGRPGERSFAIARPYACPSAEVRSAVGGAVCRRARESVRALLLQAVSACAIVNHMVQYMRARLDASFAALSDAT